MSMGHCLSKIHVGGTHCVKDHMVSISRGNGWWLALAVISSRMAIETTLKTSAVRLTGAWLAPELMPVKCLQFQYLQSWGSWMILILNWCT